MSDLTGFSRCWPENIFNTSAKRASEGKAPNYQLHSSAVHVSHLKFFSLMQRQNFIKDGKYPHIAYVEKPKPATNQPDVFSDTMIYQARTTAEMEGLNISETISSKLESQRTAAITNYGTDFLLSSRKIIVNCRGYDQRSEPSSMGKSRCQLQEKQAKNFRSQHYSGFSQRLVPVSSCSSCAREVSSTASESAARE